MKKILVILGLSAMLLTTNAFAANLETRTYDEGGENIFYLSITISNVAWDSIEKIPSDIDEFCEWYGLDANDTNNLPVWLENRTIARTIDRIYETTDSDSNSDYIYIGAAAPCNIDMAPGGVPIIEKLTPINEGDSLVGTRKIGSIFYRAENLDIKNITALSEGLYLINNYTNGTYELMNSHGAGGMYWYDLILNVKNPATTTNADAYVQIINKFSNNDDYVSEQLIAFKNQVPVIINDRTLVPMRDIFEALNCDVTWEEDTATVTATSKDGTNITLTIGNNIMTKNTTAIELDVAPQIINDSTMVPVRAISEALDLTVEWNDNEKIVSIVKFV